MRGGQCLGQSGSPAAYEPLQLGGVPQQDALCFRRYVAAFAADPMRLSTQGATEALCVKAGATTFNAPDHERKNINANRITRHCLKMGPVQDPLATSGSHFSSFRNKGACGHAVLDSGSRWGISDPLQPIPMHC
jgi:hypothetical protein